MQKTPRGNRRRDLIKGPNNKLANALADTLSVSRKKALAIIRGHFLEPIEDSGVSRFHKVLNVLEDKALDGDVQAIKLIMSFTAGRPGDGDTILPGSVLPNIIVYNQFPDIPTKVIDVELKE